MAQRRTTRRRSWRRRLLLHNNIQYINITGCRGCALPHPSPPSSPASQLGALLGLGSKPLPQLLVVVALLRAPAVVRRQLKRRLLLDRQLVVVPVYIIISLVMFIFSANPH